MFEQLLSTMRVVALPMKTNFRGVTTREVALFEGEYGWVEFSPFLEYGDREASKWLSCTLEAASQEAPTALRRSIPINGTIPAINGGVALREIIESYPGAKTFKVKVGEDIAKDLLRLRAVSVLRPDAAIRLDVNGLWSVDEALSHLGEIYREISNIQYVEQPCATLDELRELKSRADFPITIAADEVIRKSENPLALDLEGAADIVMLKVQPLGGISRSLAIAAHYGLPAVVSSALESAVGIRYGMALAASMSDLNFDCGLATGALVARDVASLPIIDGAIKLSDLDIKLDGLDVSPERYEWWKNRTMRCAELLS